MFVFANFNCSTQISSTILCIDSFFPSTNKPLYFVLDNSSNFNSTLLPSDLRSNRLIVKDFRVNLGYLAALLCSVSFLNESNLHPEFVYLLNPDLFFEFNIYSWLKKAASICTLDPQIGIITPAVYELIGARSPRFSRIRPSAKPWPTVLDSFFLFFKAFIFLRPLKSLFPLPRSGIEKISVVHGSSMCFTRSFYKILPPTIPIFLYGEEQFLESYLRDHGFLCCIDHDQHFIHTRSGPTKFLSRLNTASLYFSSSVVRSFLFRPS
jgi:GT2 family glycosyltransferase